MNSLTCCLNRGVVSSKPTIRNRGIRDKNNSHGVARRLHLCACRYRATESLQSRGIGQHTIDNLKKQTNKQNTRSDQQKINSTSILTPGIFLISNRNKLITDSIIIT